ncbi:metallophosphoesterase [Bradyrhizobium sp. dw_411]|uniref:metallophosphoesterase n=1 Tax=Bradyrhizobium sp. dw_411 TaxID=2720082 RepID=UPI001BCB2E14|nr:metallophosphoesterase [Bradyrhizobium sp. dw_411]
MKLQIMSDLHIDYPGSRSIPRLAPGVDAVVVAGDTCQGLVQSIERLRRTYPSPTEIVMVAGNHELWSNKLSFDEHFDAGHAAADMHRVHLLENAAQIVRGVRFLGATLWTSYDLYGPDVRDAAMHAAGAQMLDHKRIKWSRDPWKRFRPTEARILHQKSRMFFEEELARPHAGPSVCISHHAMTMDAIAPTHQRSVLSAAYASEMQPMIDRFQPDLVVTGHTHHSIDLRRGRTRMISNPAGYAGENRQFDPAFVVDLAG